MLENSIEKVYFKDDVSTKKAFQGDFVVDRMTMEKRKKLA